MKTTIIILLFLIFNFHISDTSANRTTTPELADVVLELNIQKIVNEEVDVKLQKLNTSLIKLNQNLREIDTLNR